MEVDSSMLGYKNRFGARNCLPESNLSSVGLKIISPEIQEERKKILF